MAESTLNNPLALECLVDGKPAGTLSVLDRGLSYGDGVFETLRVAHGQIGLLEYHLARLRRGLSVLRLTVDLDGVTNELNAVARRLHNGVIKLTLTRGTGPRGYAMPHAAQPTRICQSLPPVTYPAERFNDGIRLFECQTRLAIQPLLAGIKHLNRLEQVLARSEWTDPAYAEGLVRDIGGDVIECTMSNLFVRHDGHWITPDLRGCGVRGVMRDYLIDRLGESGQPVTVRSIDYASVLRSTEIFCCNSLYGVWPIVGLADKSWPVGPQTRQAQAMAEQVIK
jgi:4-amino-4-deoxychorismate lyase